MGDEDAHGQSRALERIGDQAVDFAEQCAFMITGDRVGFERSLVLRGQ